MTRAKLGLLSLLAALVVVLALFAGSAAALPGDPPITPLSPADGASVPAVEEGLKVSYTCPAYRTAEEPVEEEEEGGEEEGGEEEGGEEGEGGGEEEAEKLIPVFGGSEEYEVHFSTSSSVGGDGRLGTAGFGESGEAEAEAVKGTPNCTSELELPTSPNPAVLFQGRVFWQAFRECEGCASGFETGPVRSFIVVPTIEEAEITYENHVYAKYLTKINFFASSGLKGARVLLQQWTGSEWKTIAEEPGTELGENSFFVKLGAGHRLLRPVVVGTGVSLALEEKSKVVRHTKRATRTPVATGPWAVVPTSEREEFPLAFRVTNGGTVLRGLSASVEAICRVPGTVPAQKVTIEATSNVRSVPIAPNGSVVAHFATSGATPTTVTLTGSFFAGRFTGLLTSAFLNCAGFREFEAVPAPPKAK